LRGRFGGYSLLTQLRSLFYDIAKISLKGGYQALVFEWRAVTGEIRFEIQFLEGFECTDPFIKLRVAHVCDLRFHQIAGTNDFFFREEHDGIAIRMAAPKEQ